MTSETFLGKRKRDDVSSSSSSSSLSWIQVDRDRTDRKGCDMHRLRHLLETKDTVGFTELLAKHRGRVTEDQINELIDTAVASHRIDSLNILVCGLAKNDIPFGMRQLKHWIHARISQQVLLHSVETVGHMIEGMWKFAKYCTITDEEMLSAISEAFVYAESNFPDMLQEQLKYVKMYRPHLLGDVHSLSVKQRRYTHEAFFPYTNEIPQLLQDKTFSYLYSLSKHCVYRDVTS